MVKPAAASNVVQLADVGLAPAPDLKALSVAPASADRLNLRRLRSSMLRRAVAAWAALTGGDGPFVLGQHGSERDLWCNPALSDGRSYLVVVDADSPVDEWPMLRRGTGHRDTYGHPLICGRIGDFPAPSLRPLINRTVVEAVEHRRVLAHRVVGPGPRGNVAYDVCRFPIVDSSGAIARLLTKSDVYIPLSGLPDQDYR